MVSPATAVGVKTEGIVPPESVTLVSPGPDPAMAALSGVGVISASVNEDGYWKAHLVRGGLGDNAPMDCITTIDGDDLEVELIEDSGPDNHLVVIFRGICAGGPSREMVRNVLARGLPAGDVPVWWGTVHPKLGARPGDVYDRNPDAVMAAARHTVNDATSRA